MSGPIPAERIDREIADILAAEEFRTARETAGTETRAVGELFDSLLRAAEAMLGDLRANHPGLFVVILLAGLIVIAVSVYFGARGLARRKGPTLDLGGPRTQAELQDPALLRKQAFELAAKDDYVGASRRLFRASIIERALQEGALRRLEDALGFRRAYTFQELARAFARDTPEADELGWLARRLDAGVYGAAPFGEADWARARALDDRLVGR